MRSESFVQCSPDIAAEQGLGVPTHGGPAAARRGVTLRGRAQHISPAGWTETNEPRRAGQRVWVPESSCLARVPVLCCPSLRGCPAWRRALVAGQPWAYQQGLQRCLSACGPQQASPRRAAWRLLAAPALCWAAQQAEQPAPRLAALRRAACSQTKGPPRHDARRAALLGTAAQPPHAATSALPAARRRGAAFHRPWRPAAPGQQARPQPALAPAQQPAQGVVRMGQRRQASLAPFHQPARCQAVRVWLQQLTVPWRNAHWSPRAQKPRRKNLHSCCCVAWNCRGAGAEASGGALDCGHHSSGSRGGAAGWLGAPAAAQPEGAPGRAGTDTAALCCSSPEGRSGSPGQL